MPKSHRSSCRNVHIYNGSITEAVFLSMLNDVLPIADAPLEVKQRRSEHTILPTSNALELGVYDVYCNGSMKITKNAGSRASSQKVQEADTRIPFETGTHVFPLEMENIWLTENCGKYISDMGNAPDVAKINSCQNGLLLSASVHVTFDSGLISVNPDDGYRIIVFSGNVMGIDGNFLDLVCRNPDDPRRVSDDLLRWHFRQSVLANMRGLGEPVFEHDFPPGGDMMHEIMEGPYGKERLELEFARRLRMKAPIAVHGDEDT